MKATMLFALGLLVAQAADPTGNADAGTSQHNGCFSGPGPEAQQIFCLLRPHRSLAIDVGLFESCIKWS
jgi:hypothetical protein